MGRGLGAHPVSLGCPPQVAKDRGEPKAGAAAGIASQVPLIVSLQVSCWVSERMGRSRLNVAKGELENAKPSHQAWLVMLLLGRGGNFSNKELPLRWSWPDLSIWNLPVRLKLPFALQLVMLLAFSLS